MNKREAVLGIIERTGQISVDNALQYVSDVKEDIDLYEGSIRRGRTTGCTGFL